MAPGDQRWPSLRWVAGATATILVVWGAVQLVGSVVTPIFLVVVAALLAFVLHFPIDLFSRWVPRPLATFFTLLLVLGHVAVLLAWILPQLYHQGALLVSRLPELVTEAGALWNRLQQRSPLVQLEGAHLPERIEQELAAKTAALVSNVLPIASGVIATALGIVFVLGVAFFLAYRPSLYVEGFLRLVPTAHEESVRSFFQRLTHVMRGWIAGALVSMTTVGCLTALGTYLLGLDSWLLLGFLSFVGEIVPYAGPILASIPAVALALADSPMHALYTALLYLGIQQLEGNAITPIVMKRAIEIPPALLLLWQIAMASAFGIVALFVAAPLLATLLVGVDHFWVKRTLHKS